MSLDFKNFQSPHTHLSSLDTGSTIDEFVKRELELGTGTLTVTDHGYLGACRDVYRVAKENKLTPILGIEGYHYDPDCPIIQKAGITDIKSYYKYGHITMHALDQVAYEALVKKVSLRDLTAERHGSERKPLFTWSDLEELGSYNMTLMSGCLIGLVSRHIMAGRPDLAKQAYEKIRGYAKPGNFYVELFTHRCDKNWVSGVFLHLEDGTKLKYYMGKKVRTSTIDEITVADLSKAFKRGEDVGNVVAVKNRSVWEEIEKRKIVECNLVQDFIPNEPQDWCLDGDVQLGCNKLLLQWANEFGDKTVISDDAHYAHPDDRVVQDAKLGGMGDSFRFYGNYARHTSNDAWKYFNEYLNFNEKQFSQLVENNNEWASRFKDFTLINKPSLPTSFYPSDTLAHVKTLIDKHGRMNWKDKVEMARLKEEIDLLHKNGTIDLLTYTFVLEEVCSFYEQQGLLTGVGRGSAGGLRLAYLLGITHVDPLKYGLSLDRFLTIDRIKSNSLPDIDQDLPDRDILLGENGYLRKRFGECFAQISTDTLLRVKSGIEDAARASWGQIPDFITKLTKSIPPTPQGIEDINFLMGYEREDGKEERGLLETHKGLQEYVKAYPQQWNIVKKFLGIKRNKSVHASASIIANESVSNFIPLMTVNETRATQYTAQSCEESGAIKMDFLGLKTLIDLSMATKLIQENSNMEIPDFIILNGKRVPKVRIVPHEGQLLDIWDLPEDQNVFRNICEGKNETVFQLNTQSASGWMKEFNHWKHEATGRKSIDSIMGIATFTALDRPGPLDASVENDDGQSRNMLQEYAARLRGMTPYGAIPFLDENLPETKGIIIFQEQLTKIFQLLTDCDGIKATKFRKDAAKKEMEKVLKYYPDFITKATEKVGEETAKKVWDQMVTFAQYGFNLSHSVSYGITAYACAYLKHYFPLQWWCAVLRNADKSQIGPKFWRYCRELVQLPNINDSKEDFYIKDDKIIAPLSMLMGVGINAHKELSEGAPFKDIQDFTDKIAKTKESKAKKNEETGKTRAGVSSLNKGVVSKLIVSGALDSLFTETTDLVTKLELYQAALARSLNKKRPEKVDSKYVDLSSLKLYQHKKSILPVYSEFLVPYLVGLKIDGVNQKTIKMNKTTLEMYSYSPQNPHTIGQIMQSMGRDSLWASSLPFVDGNVLEELNVNTAIPEGGNVKIAVAAYVLEYRKFKYTDKQSGKVVEAVDFDLDIDGNIFKFLKWPNKSKRANILPTTELKGAIIVAILSKSMEDRPFTIEAIVSVVDPLNKETNEN